MLLFDQKVVITGGATGIGLALARAFRDRGNAVLICGRRVERLTEATQAISGLFAVRCDVKKEDDLSHLVDAACSKLGGISILVNNAGIQHNDRYGETEPDTIMGHVDDEVEINFSGLVKLTALFLPLIRSEDEGAVVNISSMLALAPKQSAPVYCATKAAVHSFSKALRYQLEDWAPNVKVFEVLASLVDTEMTRERIGKKLPPEHVAMDVMKAMERNRYEISVGTTRKMALLQRIHPGLVERALRRR